MSRVKNIWSKLDNWIKIPTIVVVSLAAFGGLGKCVHALLPVAGVQTVQAAEVQKGWAKSEHESIHGRINGLAESVKNCEDYSRKTFNALPDKWRKRGERQ